MSDESISPLTRLYLERRIELVRFFTARAGSAAVAEDIVQELYLKVQQIDATDIRNEMAYLYRLGLNLMIDRLRSEVRSRARERDYVDTHDGPEDHTPSAEEGAMARERMRAVLAAIEDLPPQCRRVFRMHRFEEVNQGEIAARLGISRRVVEKHISNALRRLAEVMK